VTITSPKRIGALALTAAMAVAACGGAASPTPPPAPPPAGLPRLPPRRGGRGRARDPDRRRQPTGWATFPRPSTRSGSSSTGPTTRTSRSTTAIGSGGGIKNITEQTVDFGASDAAMKDEEIAALPAGTQIVHIPTALGAVVVIFNVDGGDGPQARRPHHGRHLPRQDTKWNDPAIAALNGGTTLPDQEIVVAIARTGRHDQRLHQLPGRGQRRVEEGPGAGKDRPVADRHRGQGQRRRGRRHQADEGRGRLRRAPVRRQERPHLGLPEERRRQLRPGSTEGVTRRRRRGQQWRRTADRRRSSTAPGQHLPDRVVHLPLVYVAQEDQAKGQALVPSPTGPSPTGRAGERPGYAPLRRRSQQKALETLPRSLRGAPIWPCSGSPSQPPPPGEAILCFGAGSSRRASPGGPAVVP